MGMPREGRRAYSPEEKVNLRTSSYRESKQWII